MIFGDFEIALILFIYMSNFRIFRNALRQFIPNCSCKNVITSTNYKPLGTGLKVNVFKVCCSDYV